MRLDDIVSRSTERHPKNVGARRGKLFGAWGLLRRCILVRRRCGAPMLRRRLRRPSSAGGKAGATAMGFFVDGVSTVTLSAGVLLAASGASGTLDDQTATGVQKAGQLRLSSPVDHLGKMARETMIVEHPSGALFVAGYGDSMPTLWRSSDRGKTWQEVNVGGKADGAGGNSDVDLSV